MGVATYNNRRPKYNKSSFSHVIYYLKAHCQQIWVIHGSFEPVNVPCCKTNVSRDIFSSCRTWYDVVNGYVIPIQMLASQRANQLLTMGYFPQINRHEFIIVSPVCSHTQLPEHSSSGMFSLVSSDTVSISCRPRLHLLYPLVTVL